MTTRADYTLEEWEFLKETPFMVGAAVAAVARSGFGTMSELLTIITGTTGGILQFPENELIQSLLKDDERPNSFKEIEREELKSAALDRCRRAAAILDKKAPVQEAREYRRWVISVGEAVASAAKEGGFLGIGGERVSQRESALLEEIADAIGS